MCDRRFMLKSQISACCWSARHGHELAQASGVTFSLRIPTVTGHRDRSSLCSVASGRDTRRAIREDASASMCRNMYVSMTVRLDML